MTDIGWDLDARLERRRKNALQRVALRKLKLHRLRAAWRRDVARVALAASTLVLAVIVVEMTLKATHFVAG